jgi:peptide/nickel transport system substrate-binding protein
LLVGVLIAACAPSSAPQSAPAERPGQTIIFATRTEPSTIASKPLNQAGSRTATVVGLFNATLLRRDERGTSHPYLAEAVPQLNTESWRVFPDGTMETTYRLKPNLRWHDGTPLTAEDFVFGWRVYATLELGTAGTMPYRLIREVVAPDARTVLVRWDHSFPSAADLHDEDPLPPLPRHILEQPLRDLAPDAFGAHPYWTSEYVGLGPYQSQRWEPGTAIDGMAFEGYVLGRPKIDRLRVLFIADRNVTLANLLAGAVHVSSDDSISFEQAVVLRREWAPTNGGTVIPAPTGWRNIQVQLRPEVMAPRSLADPRVRRALAFTLDKQSLNDALFEGEGHMADTMVEPSRDYFPEVDRAIVKYSFDARRSEQLMAESGFTKGSDGVYNRPDEGRFSGEIKVLGSSQNQAEMAILADIWRRSGFEFSQATFSPAQFQDGRARSSFTSLHPTGGPIGEPTYRNLGIDAISTPENRWIGSNRGAWAHEEYDRLLKLFDRTLDRSERVRHVVQMMRIVSEEVPTISLYFNLYINAYRSEVKATTAYGDLIGQHVHEWELRD